MKQKFFKKFFLTSSLLMLASITVITILLSIFVSNYMTREKKKVLRENCVSIRDAIVEYSGKVLNPSESLTLFRTMSRVTESEIFLSDMTGHVLACSCEEWSIDGLCEHNSEQISEAIMQQVSTGEYQEAGDMDGLFSQVQFTYGMPLKNKNGTIMGAVFSTLSLQSIRLFYNSILRLFFLSALLPIVLMFFAEYYISYRFTKPLHLMAEASRSMAKGDFSKRIPVTGDDEIGELSVAFNQMTNSLVQLEGTRRRFIANVSHELKTPMTTIGGFVDGLVDGTIPPDKQSYYLSLISAETKRLSRLVQSMLSLAKLESGEQQVNQTNFDITDMVVRVVFSQEQRISERRLVIVGLEDMPKTMVYADYDLIYQVVYNLVDNAIKFTNEGGTIRLQTNRFDNMVEFRICNTGEGIEPNEIPFVFERFYKSDRSRSAVKDSTGLGLHLASTILAIHGGKITVKSKVNEMTEFAFYLPVPVEDTK